MILKPFDQITEQDLQSLVNNSILEGKTIEYKQDLIISADKEKKEFLADISSFANASGGDLIYGIVEDRSRGTPERLEGMLIPNEDEEIRRLEEMIRYGIAPRIPSVEIKSVELSNFKKALVIRILKSWVSPHRVVFKEHDKFYSRNSKGKYPLDVGELRVAFNLSNSITGKIRKFRENRISNIYANETPISFLENPKVVLHIIPLSAVNSSQTYDMSKLPFNPMSIKPIRVSSRDGRYNLDGYLTYRMEFGEKASSYVQLYRNGIIEAVDVGLLDSPDSRIRSIYFEKNIMNSFDEYLSYSKMLNVGLPIFAFLTLIDVKGYDIIPAKPHLDPRISIESKIEKDVLLIPEIVIEDFNFDVEKVLKPWFDTIWNACGFPYSLNFDDSGKWTGRA